MYVGLWPSKSRVMAFVRKREITGEPLNSRSQILAPNRREITGVDCTKKSNAYLAGTLYMVLKIPYLQIQ